MPAPPPLAPAFDPTSSDADLMRRIVAQDQSALMALYERFGSQVFGLALRVPRNSRLAEEASQDAFLKVWNPCHLLSFVLHWRSARWLSLRSWP